VNVWTGGAVNLIAFFNELDDKGIELYRIGDTVKVKAPKGVLTPAHRQILKEYKAEVLSLIDFREGDISEEPTPASVEPSTAGAYAWEEHLADLLDLSRYPLLPCEECSRGDFKIGTVKHWRPQWLCIHCVRGLTRAELKRNADELAVLLAAPEEDLTLFEDLPVDVQERRWM
jgi:hypothetical protein